MTDKISNEAYALAADLHNSGDATIERTEMLLTIIEHSALEDAAKVCDAYDENLKDINELTTGQSIAANSLHQKILALKVQS